jgi:membrane carboxypeptidase/penicillin-binding protein
MSNVHGQEVAGATFPVPIWHEYMAAALWHQPVIDFATPNSYPVYRPLHQGSYGPLQPYSSPRPVYTLPAATTTTTTAPTPPPPPPVKPSRPPGGSH